GRVDEYAREPKLLDRRAELGRVEQRRKGITPAGDLVLEHFTVDDRRVGLIAFRGECVGRVGCLLRHGESCDGEHRYGEDGHANAVHWAPPACTGSVLATYVWISNRASRNCCPSRGRRAVRAAEGTS